MSTEIETPTITPELVPDESKELAVVIRQNALPTESAQSLQSSFAPFFAEARTILAQSRAITVTDAGQRLQIKLARECRLALRGIRVGADKKRKELKDESLRTGKAIDGFFNILLHITETEENRLDEQEKFAERQEEARKAALRAKREQELVALAIDPNLYQLGEMSEETFQTLVQGTKLARAAQEAARVKAEADRIAREAADLAERERISAENERLKVEAEAREAAAKIEREAAARAAAEAEARAMVERDAAAATLRAERIRLEAEAAAERQRAAKAAEEAAAKAKIEREAVEAKAKADREAQEAAFRAQRKKEQDVALAAAERLREQREAEAAKAKVDREAREKAEAELKAQRDAAAKKAADEAAAAKKAAAAPDKVKLLRFAGYIRDAAMPDLTTEPAQNLAAHIANRMDDLAIYIETEAQKL